MKDFFEKIEWTPSIGDPSFMGWFTVFAYFVCAYYSFRVFHLGERIFGVPVLRQRRLWLIIAGSMCFLGLNKQLDLQTFFTASARYLALEQGWYQDRQSYQKLFILLVGGSGCALLVTVMAAYIRVIRIHLVAIIGLTLLLVFVFVRASSFHHMDTFIGVKLLGMRMNWVMELSAIGLIFYNARLLLRKLRPLIDLNTLQRKPVDRDDGAAG